MQDRHKTEELTSTVSAHGFSPTLPSSVAAAAALVRMRTNSALPLSILAVTSPRDSRHALHSAPPTSFSRTPFYKARNTKQGIFCAARSVKRTETHVDSFCTRVLGDAAVFAGGHCRACAHADQFSASAFDTGAEFSTGFDGCFVIRFTDAVVVDAILQNSKYKTHATICTRFL